MATIYDVAKRAGVSPKTVSRVLNGDAPVSKKTRSSVAAAMDALGYVPSLAARSIKSQKSGLIGLITGAISTVNEVVTAGGLPELFIVQGVQHVMANSGKTLLIADTAGQQERVPTLIRTFREHRVEGLLYVADFHKKIALPLPIDGVQTVLANCYDDFGTPSVLPDDEAGQLALTREVIAQGHRRIGYLTLASGHEATRLRLSGFKTALAEAGLVYDPDLTIAVDMFGTHGEHQLIWDALDRILTNDDVPTAICCGNDRLAMAVYGILRDRGVGIPEQMSVAGYDDHRTISEALFPALTTAELPYNAIGARAAQLLLGMIENPATASITAPIHVSGRVQKRGSVTRPRRDASVVINLKGRTTS